jgi:DNA-binding NtrC family response regulator
MKVILVVSKDERAIEAIRDCFRGYDVERIGALEMISAERARRQYEYVFIEMSLLVRDLGEGTSDYRQAMVPLRRALPAAHIVVMSRPESIRETVKAVKAGADSYLTYPVVPEEVALIREGIEEAVRARAELDHLRDPFWEEDRDLVRTESEPMRSLYTKLRQVAPTRSTVLLTGETGTGKNVLAKLIHRRSNRAQKQFIGVHCGAIVDSLLESELFGHERGAFTGAVRRKMGKFEIADGGTLFLDEIGTISAAMQIKLLEVLQDQTFHRVGGETTQNVDVRILAATNVDLEHAVSEGVFRKDLFFRLNVFPIHVPALRERLEDIPLLTRLFLERLNILYQREIVEVHPLVLEAFSRYDWPGNVRELESLMERAYILESTNVLSPESFPREMITSSAPLEQTAVNTNETLAVVRQRAVNNVERVYLKEQLEEHEGRINRTARAAGITERQLHKLMVKHTLRKEDFRKPRGRRVRMKKEA